jgi:hypothetical protein
MTTGLASAQPALKSGGDAMAYGFVVLRLSTLHIRALQVETRGFLPNLKRGNLLWPARAPSKTQIDDNASRLCAIDCSTIEGSAVTSTR